MDLIKSLFDSGVLGGLATIVVTFLGQLVALNTKKFTDVLEALTKAQAGDGKAHDDAFKRSGTAGERVRHWMLMMGFIALLGGAFYCAQWNVPMVVEHSEQFGGWLWGLIPERESVVFTTIQGFYMSEVWKELMLNLISAYIGAGITRKAFQLGK